MSSVILQFTEPAPYMFAPYDHTAPILGGSYTSSSPPICRCRVYASAVSF